MRTFFNLWVSSSVILFYFGPIEWPGRTEPWVALFVGVCVITFNMGYAVLVRPGKIGYSNLDLFGVLRDRRVGIALALLYAVLSVIQMQIVTGQSVTSSLMSGLRFTTVYTDYQLYIEQGVKISGAERVALMLKAVLFPVMLVLICRFYGKSSLILILFFVPMMLFSLARGTDKETTDIILILAIIAYYKGTNRSTKFLLAFGALAVLWLFVLRKHGRFGNMMPNCLPGTVTCFDMDSMLAQISPQLEIGYVLVTHYLTQGYEGLNIAFTLDFEFNFGLGHLPPIKSFICEIFKTGCDLQNFSDRLMLAGWDTRSKWSSVYTALADDLHWVFVPLYTFFIGWSLRLAEHEWKQRANPTALAVIVLIGIFTLYSSANMQLAISPDWALATIFLLYGKALSIRTKVK